MQAHWCKTGTNIILIYALGLSESTTGCPDTSGQMVYIKINSVSGHTKFFYKVLVAPELGHTNPHTPGASMKNFHTKQHLQFKWYSDILCIWIKQLWYLHFYWFLSVFLEIKIFCCIHRLRFWLLFFRIVESVAGEIPYLDAVTD